MAEPRTMSDAELIDEYDRLYTEEARTADGRIDQATAHYRQLDIRAELLRRLTAPDAPGTVCISDNIGERERLYGYLENINAHLGSLRNSFGVVRHIEAPKIGTPVYHLQAAEEYVSRLYNQMVKFVSDPGGESERAAAPNERDRR